MYVRTYVRMYVRVVSRTRSHTLLLASMRVWLHERIAPNFRVFRGSTFNPENLARGNFLMQIRRDASAKIVSTKFSKSSENMALYESPEHQTIHQEREREREREREERKQH